MGVILDRKYKKANYTISKLYINGKYICDTCEDKDRGLTKDMLYKDIISKKVCQGKLLNYSSTSITFVSVILVQLMCPSSS